MSLLPFLLACDAPETLGSVAAALGQDAVADGTPGTRMTIAVAGLLAETCGVSDIDSYVFSSRAAAALGAARADVVRVVDEGTQAWTFAGAGLDDQEPADLLISTDADAENLAVEWDNGAARFTAGIELRDCDTSVPSVVVGGSGKWLTTGLEVAFSLTGVSPLAGVVYAPPLGDAPVTGQIRATNQVDGWVVLLDDASVLGETPEAWPGVASGKGWQTSVVVPWP